MSHARSQHPNAVLTPKGRKKMVDCVLRRRWTIEATAERFQVDAKTVTKWRNRFLAEGVAGLQDRSSRPHRSPNKTPEAQCQRVIELRKKRRWGAEHIGHEVRLAPSTVQSILTRAGLGRLDRGDRATASEPVHRYQRDRPGELVHVDVKKLAGIPDGGGWRIHGRLDGPDHTGAGYRYIHSVIDDRTRVAYSEILDDEKGHTAAGFWRRAHAWFAAMGITIERVLSDNGACYRSNAWRSALEDTGVVHKRTRPYRPQTNGKIERFHRILLEEWAYIRDWHSETERHLAYDGFLHFYNHHRSHGALGWATPIETLNRFLGDNVPGGHI